MSEQPIIEGYVYINEQGEYAQLGIRKGFGADQEVITFCQNLDQATIFRSRNEKHRQLTNCQSLVANEIRIVRLGVGTTKKE